MTYAEHTIRDRNPVKRWLHRRRFFDSLHVLQGADEGQRLRVLDYGAGNGELVRQMAGAAPMEATIFEPTPALMAEAKVNLAHLDAVTFVESLDAVEPATFDLVFCLEVFDQSPPISHSQPRPASALAHFTPDQARRSRQPRELSHRRQRQSRRNGIPVAVNRRFAEWSRAPCCLGSCC